MPATPYTIRLAVSDAERLDLYRFRFRALDDRARQREPGVDAVRRLVSDPLDRFALVFGAWRLGQCIGTVRFNLLRDGDVGAWRGICGVEHLTQREARRASITSRLVVHRSWRDSPLAADLAAAALAFADDVGVADDYLVCDEPLVPQLRAVGYEACRALSATDDARVLHLALGRSATPQGARACDNVPQAIGVPVTHTGAGRRGAA